jgi:hypothetical protein
VSGWLRARARLLGLWFVLGSLGLASSARADDQVVYARVVVGTAAVRTGPGATFRIVRVASQGDTFPVHERATRGYWLRVELPDGSLAWIQGDAVYVHEVGQPSRWQRFLARVFAPPPLLGARGEIAFTLGTLSRSGFLALRPSWLLAPPFAIEANLGASVGSSGRLFLGGLGGVVNVFPSWRIVPFFTVGGGAARALPNADTFVLEAGTRSMMYGGGGLRFGFRQRLIVRIEGRGYTFFDENTLVAQQEVSGGLSAFF